MVFMVVKSSMNWTTVQQPRAFGEDQCFQSSKASIATPVVIELGSKTRSKGVEVPLKLVGNNRHRREIFSRGCATTAADVHSVGHDAKSTAAFRVSKKFAALKKRREVAFMPYLTAGDPNLETTAAAVHLLERCGADILELGVPFSDPLADGPVLQAAAKRALLEGTNLDSVLTLMREDLADIRMPIMLFLYYNTLLKRGVTKFVEEAKAAGASGILVPDLPLENTGKLRKLTAAAGLELVLLTTPTTPNLRMTKITKASEGFIYLVSQQGVAGTGSSSSASVENLLKGVKNASEKPIAVGIGISTPEQAAKLAEWGADGVIIGSAIVKRLAESGSPEAGLQAVQDLALQFRAALSANRQADPHPSFFLKGSHYKGLQGRLYHEYEVLIRGFRTTRDAIREKLFSER